MPTPIAAHLIGGRGRRMCIISRGSAMHELPECKHEYEPIGPDAATDPLIALMQLILRILATKDLTGWRIDVQPLREVRSVQCALTEPSGLCAVRAWHELDLMAWSPEEDVDYSLSRMIEDIKWQAEFGRIGA